MCPKFTGPSRPGYFGNDVCGCQNCETLPAVPELAGDLLELLQLDLGREVAEVVGHHEPAANHISV